MTSADIILQNAADSGVVEPEEWPRTLKYILDRLDEIINDFPRPNAPVSPNANASAPPQQQNPLSSQESHTTDKENAPPATPPRPPVPAFAGASPSSSTTALPQDIVNFYASIRTILSTNFPTKPPHTVQRLAELILHPKRHYRFLPSYLRALDRVVSVTSATTAFPLDLGLPSTDNLSLNGNPAPQVLPGSDESLGGALLTPIPWLQNHPSQSELISESTEMVEGPNGAGRIETVTVMSGNPTMTSSPAAQSQIASSHPDGETLPYTGPVTQGEILRQEQEAGVVLSNPHSIAGARTPTGEAENGSVIDTVEGDEETPHARGPEVIGMEDTGPQKPSGNGLDIEGAVGRPSLERRSKSPSRASSKDDEQMADTGGDKKAEVETEAAAETEAEAEAGGQAEDQAKDVEMKTDG